MWQKVILKWDSYVLVIGSMLYGFQLYVFPNILENFAVYQIIREMFDHKTIGLIFMAISLIKLVGIITNNSRIKFFAVRGLIFLWMLFMVSFLLTPPQNTVWIMAFMALSLGLGIIIREE